MLITKMQVTQMHDIVKTLQDRPESVKEILWREGPWLGEELENAWGNYYEVQGYLPFATCGNDQCRNKDLCVLTSAASPSTSFRQNGRNVNPFGAMASVAGDRSGPWTGWINPAPV